MKFSNKALPIFLLLFLKTTFYINAQGYQPILNGDSVSWDIAYKEMSGIQSFKLITVLSDDSIYYELYSNMYLYDPDADPELYMGKLREDTVSGKIWYVDIYDHEEALIMDMTLSVGDTFEINPGHWHTVDSVFYKNNRKIIQFDLSSAHWIEKVQFIEGVGPNMSILYRYDAWYYFYATCQYQNNELVYINDNGYFFDGCSPLPTGISSFLEMNAIQIYPNPTQSKIWINLNFAHHDTTTISIYDSKGRIVLREDFYGSNHMFNLDDLRNGIYFVTAINSNQTTRMKLILTN